MVAVLFAVAAVIASLSLSCYLVGREHVAGAISAIGAKSLKLYNHVLHRIDRFSERGWRRCFGWLGVAVGYYAFIHAPSHGVVVDTDAVNVFLAMVTGTFVARGVEQIARTRNTTSPTGGLVNNVALAA